MKGASTGWLDRAGEGVVPGLLLVGTAAPLAVVVCLLGGMPILWTVLGAAAIAFGCVFLLAPDKKLFLFACYMLLMPLGAAKWFLREPYFFFGGSPKALVVFISDLPFFALFAIWLAEVGLKKRRVRFPRTHLPFVLGLVWSALSLVKAGDPVLGFLDLLKMIKFYVIYLVVANLLEDRRWIQWAVGLLLFDLALQATLNIASYFLHGQLTVWGLRKYEFQRFAGEDVFRATGTMGPHNVQAHFYEMTLPLAMVLAFSFRRVALRAIGTVLLVAGGIALTLTFSRGGWAAGAIGLVLVTFFLLGRRLMSVATVSLIALAGIASLAGFLLGPENVIGKRITASPRAATVSRWEMVKVGGRMILANPILGVGQNNSQEVIGRYFPEEGPPKEVWWPVDDTRLIIPIHNKYLLAAAENGLPGLAFFLWFLAAWLGEGWTCLKARDGWVVALATWLIAANVGVSFHNALSEFSYSSIIESFYLLAAIQGALYLFARKEGLLPGGGENR